MVKIAQNITKRFTFYFIYLAVLNFITKSDSVRMAFAATFMWRVLLVFLVEAHPSFLSSLPCACGLPFFTRQIINTVIPTVIAIMISPKKPKGTPITTALESSSSSSLPTRNRENSIFAGWNNNYASFSD